MWPSKLFVSSLQKHMPPLLGPGRSGGKGVGGGGEWGWVSTPKTSLFRKKKNTHTHSKQTEKATTTTTTTGQGLKAQAFDSRFPQANEERISERYQIARPQFEFILFTVCSLINHYCLNNQQLSFP